MLEFTSLILEPRRELLEKKLIAMQRKAKKMGLPPITYLFTAVNDPVYLYEDQEGMRYTSATHPNVMAKDFPSHEFTGYQIERVSISVWGESPVFDGWKFVAALNPTADRTANLLLTIPHYTNPNLMNYTYKVGICEHCNTTRYRKDTFVVEHQNGKLKAVGRQCLSSFIGGTSPEKVIQWAEMIFSIPDAINDFGDHEFLSGSNFQYITSINLRSLLAVGVRMIEKYGWMSRAEASDRNCLSTSDMCWMYFNGKPLPGETATWKCEPSDYEEADAVIEWMKTQQQTGEYFINLRTLSTQDSVTRKACGLAVSAIQTNRKQRADNATGAHIDEFFGVVGSKDTATVTLMRTFVAESFYGTRCLHSFQTLEGHTLVWWASGSTKWFEDADLGKTFVIEFRIKKHEMYRDRKQTTITHVKTISETAMA
jgi:hypothetical protein